MHPIKAAWSRALRAWEQYESMEEGSPNGYVFHPPTGRYEHLDEEGRMVLNKSSLGIDMVRYQYDDVEPIVQSLFFFQSMPFIISSYESIVCLGAAPKETDSDAFRNNRLCLQVTYLYTTTHLRNVPYQYTLIHTLVHTLIHTLTRLTPLIHVLSTHHTLSIYLQSLLNAWSFDVPSDRIEGFQLKGSRLNSLNLRSTVTTMQSTALDLKPVKPGAVNWLTTDLSVIFDSKDKQQQQQQQQQRGADQRQPTDASKQDQHPSNPFSPTSSSSARNSGVNASPDGGAISPPPSTSTSSKGAEGNNGSTTTITGGRTSKPSPPHSAATTSTATATGSLASASGEIFSGLVARSGLGLVSLEETGPTPGTNILPGGTQGGGIPSTMHPGGMLPGGVTSGENGGLGRDTYVFGLLTLEKGQMMNELCERFYKRYPYEGRSFIIYFEVLNYTTVSKNS